MEGSLMTSNAAEPGIRLARKTWANLSRRACIALREITKTYNFSIALGDLLYLNEHWYVTHSGLLGLARRGRCAGIHAHPILAFCDPSAARWAFKATVYKSRNCRGFVGYGDADPSNVSSLVRGAEMRVAETRAVNRALRKAYGIGICSVEEIASIGGSARSQQHGGKFPPQPPNRNRSGRKVRD